MAREQDGRSPPYHLKKDLGPEAEAYCPHCGAPLVYRKDYRDHLTLKICQGGTPDIFRQMDQEDPPEK